MTSTLFSRDVVTKSSRVSQLRVRRQGICFYNSAPGRVRIEVEVTNLGKERSQPSPMILRSAAFGAFAPWQPLATLMVPPIEPKGSVRVVTEVDQKRLPSLGDFADVPPPRLPATALDMGDSRGDSSETVAKWRSPGGVLLTRVTDIPHAEVTHWVGNINVFVGRVAVERHRALGLRIYPGRINNAVFVVGHAQDAYSFSLEGVPEGWGARLLDFTETRWPWHVTLNGGKVIEPRVWIEAEHKRLAVVLQLQPPLSCTKGTVEVHVHQRSSGKTAVVEFDLDPTAAGPGCYTA